MTTYRSFPKQEQKTDKSFEFATVYKHAHDEMTLQQNKRDQIITVYLALITFIVPFTFSLNNVTNTIHGLLFAALAVVGVLFGTIVARYRVYKECYWLACQTINKLTNYAPDAINKELIQGIFYACLHKKYQGLVAPKKCKIRKAKFIRTNIFSAETLYFAILTFVVGILAGLSSIFLWGYVWWKILAAVGIGLIVSLLLFSIYFKSLCRVFETLKYPDDMTTDQALEADELFSDTFKKAWMLNFYVDE